MSLGKKTKKELLKMVDLLTEDINKYILENKELKRINKELRTIKEIEVIIPEKKVVYFSELQSEKLEYLYKQYKRTKNEMYLYQIERLEKLYELNN